MKYAVIKKDYVRVCDSKKEAEIYAECENNLSDVVGEGEFYDVEEVKYAVIKKTKVYISDSKEKAKKCAKYLRERAIIFEKEGAAHDYDVEEIL